MKCASRCKASTSWKKVVELSTSEEFPFLTLSQPTPTFYWRKTRNCLWVISGGSCGFIHQRPSLNRPTRTLSMFRTVRIRIEYVPNELPADFITYEIFYSLCDYWPSMPHDVDIINENSLLSLSLYRMNERSKTVAVPAW